MTTSLTDFLLARIDERESAITYAYETGNLPFPILSPAEMLADLDAKRRIVELHGGTFLEDGTDRYLGDTCFECREDAMHPCLTLRYLALPYADHPDYDESWRP